MGSATRLQFILNVRGAEGDQRQLRRCRTASTCPTARALAGSSSTRTRTSRRARRRGVDDRHGDAHVGNTFVDGRRPLGCSSTGRSSQYGHWCIDVGYHIASALEPDVAGRGRARPARSTTSTVAAAAASTCRRGTRRGTSTAGDACTGSSSGGSRSTSPPAAAVRSTGVAQRTSRPVCRCGGRGMRSAQASGYPFGNPWCRSASSAPKVIASARGHFHG